MEPPGNLTCFVAKGIDGDSYFAEDMAMELINSLGVNLSVSQLFIKILYWSLAIE